MHGIAAMDTAASSGSGWGVGHLFFSRPEGRCPKVRHGRAVACLALFQVLALLYIFDIIDLYMTPRPLPSTTSTTSATSTTSPLPSTTSRTSATSTTSMTTTTCQYEHFFMQLPELLDQRSWVASALRAAIVGHKDSLYVYTSTAQTVCMLGNTWAQSLPSLEGRMVVHIALDRPSHEHCMLWASRPATLRANVTFKCVDLSELVPSLASGGVTFRDCKYRAIQWVKPVSLYVLSRQVRAAGVDSDVILKQGPEGSLLDWVDRHWHSERAVLCVRERYNPYGYNHLPNGGTIVVDRVSADFIRGWISKAPLGMHGGGDQGGLWALLLNLTSATNTTVEDHVSMLSDDMIGQCANEGDYGVHYNCVNKKKALLKHGRWAPPEWLSQCGA